MNDSKIEGVTFDYFLIKDKSYSTTLEDILSCMIQPYDYIQKEYGVSVKNKLMWGVMHINSARLLINIRGTRDQLEKSLEHYFKKYRLPSSILKPNKFFEESDTETGPEIAKNIILKMGGKIQTVSPFFYILGVCKEKYLVSN